MLGPLHGLDELVEGAPGRTFGLEHREPFRAEPSAEVLTWQLVVSDIDEAARACTEAGLVFEARTHEPTEGWSYRTLELVSPNGYRVTLEGPSE